ncbi:MAG TPA: hypothetical protein ENL08_00505, partial [Bacteroidetes bacterium]|nr:hypothetical protein [Bacteroidota bacterium]
MDRKFVIHLLFLGVMISGGVSGAASLQGQVVNALTGNPISDVNITVIRYSNIEPVSIKSSLLDEHLGGSTDMSGCFSIDVPIKMAVYTVRASHIGYFEAEFDARPDLEPVKVELAPGSVRLSEVVVTAGRGTPGETPGTYSNIPRQSLETAYGVQDVPLLVSASANVIAYSESGGDVGGSALKIRGFDQTRLGIT